MKGKDVQHDSLISNISNEGLLGLKFLQAYGSAIYLAKEIVTWVREQLDARCRRGYKEACQVQLGEGWEQMDTRVCQAPLGQSRGTVSMLLVHEPDIKTRPT